MAAVNASRRGETPRFKYGKEAVGVLLVAAALVCAVSLVTHDPGDPAHNTLGFVGDWFAARLFEILGGAAFAFPVFLVYWAVFQFRGGLGFERMWRLIVMVAGIFTAAGFLGLTVAGGDEAAVAAAVGRGGAVGLLLRNALAFAVGRWLALVLIGVATLVAWAWAAAAVSPARLWNATAGGVGRMGRRRSAAEPEEDYEPLGDEPVPRRAVPDEPAEEPPPRPPALTDVRPPRRAASGTEPAGRPAGRPVEPPPPPPIRPGEGYKLPPLDTLEPPAPPEGDFSPDYLADVKRKLEAALQAYRVEGRVREIRRGPRVSRFEVELQPGQKFGTLKSLEEDMARNITVPGVAITSIASRGAVAVDVPNPVATRVGLRELLASSVFQKERARSKLIVALGRRHDGQIVAADLAKMPHLLVAGATGSGKSIFLNATIMSLLMTTTPEEVQFLIVDPKRVDLAAFREIRHRHYAQVLLTEVDEAVAALKAVVGRMEGRYRLLAAVGARNIEAYNKLFRSDEGMRQVAERVAAGTDAEEGKPLPFIVVVVDELNDLMAREKARKVEEALVRLAQMARAVGIHLVVATQRPSVDVITGVIKANFPSRIAFKVSSQVDSRTILDRGGAENLLPEGDMLFFPGGAAEPERVQGAFVSDDEIRRVVEWWGRFPLPQPLFSVLEKAAEVERGMEENGGGDDELFEDAVAFCLASRMASVSMLQRRFRIGFARAGRLVDLMERRGVVGPQEGSKPRKVLVTSLDDIGPRPGAPVDDDAVL